MAALDGAPRQGGHAEARTSAAEDGHRRRLSRTTVVYCHHPTSEMLMRLIASAGLALALSLSAMPAQAETHEIIHQAFAATEAWADRLADRAQDLADQAHDAIIIGGIIVSMNRNTISGGAVGCALGAATGASSTLALAVPTAGATIAAAPNATMVGCALGAAGGAALGYSLDYPEGR
ncbi:MAG TPA: hypothetical protein VF502_06510 [Stellaceae bacterium]